MSALLDLWHSIMGIVTSGDYTSLAIMAAIAIAVGYMMENFGSIVTSTFVALVAFGLASYVVAVAKVGGKNAGTLAQTDWNSLLALTVHSLLAYGITFAIIIGVVHVIRSLVMR
jgi:cellobiose-specific phosphotransferase system component IIC